MAEYEEDEQLDASAVELDASPSEEQAGALSVAEEAAAVEPVEAADVADLDEELYDKVNRAARLLRNRKAAMAEEADEDAKRMDDLRRALKLLELKPQMEQKEMADLLGMRLRVLNDILGKAEEAGVVTRIKPEDEDMRVVLVSATEDAEAGIEAMGKKRKKLVAQLSADNARDLCDLLDEVINPLTAMGLDRDRNDRGGSRGNDRGGSRGNYGDRRSNYRD